jgi:uncharacterized protein (TIGR00730 family)
VSRFFYPKTKITIHQPLIAMNVTVFGGSEPKPGSPAYQEAYELGRLLGEAGHTVLTGGYIGTMEAASRGAAEAGGHVIGVTCDEIERWRKVKANAWVQEERRFSTLQGRLNELVQSCHAAIALPGGPGTLTEIALTWNLMIVDSMAPKPLILVGAGWKAVFEEMFRSLAATTPLHQRQMLQFAADVKAAVSLLPKP